MTPGRKPKAERNAKILALRGRKSFGVIAEELGISRSVIAGVCWRADHPSWRCRLRSGFRNKIGTGHHSHKARTPRKHKHSAGRHPATVME